MVSRPGASLTPLPEVRWHPRYLTTGETFIGRDVPVGANATSASGTMVLVYFTSLKSETTTNVACATATTAAAATPTLIRFGMWEADDAGALTLLVASTTHDATLFVSTNTLYEKAWTASFIRKAGQRYAVGILVVSGGATPLYNAPAIGGGNVHNLMTAKPPVVAATASGQSDLPPTLASGSISATRAPLYGYIS